MHANTTLAAVLLFQSAIITAVIILRTLILDTWNIMYMGILAKLTTAKGTRNVTVLVIASERKIRNWKCSGKKGVRERKLQVRNL